MQNALNFLVRALTSQDSVYANMSWIEFAWVTCLGVTLIVCVWNIWDTFGDLYYRLERNKYNLSRGDRLTGIAQASSIRAWANIRNAIVWIVKAFLYEVVGVIAAFSPPVPNPTPARALFPVIFLFLGGLLVYQVLAERRDRQRTWNAIGDRSREGFNDQVSDLAAIAIEKVEQVERSVNANIALTKEAVAGAEKAYKEANNVNIAIERLGSGLKGVQDEQETERGKRGTHADENGAP
jgi:hypothetical protein